MHRLTRVLPVVFLLAAVSVPTTAHAAFPGSNGVLVFEREAPAGDHTQTDVFTIAGDGTGLVRLTDSPGRNEFGPAWNATGSQIAFWRTKAPFGPGSIWVMDSGGHDQRQLTRGFDARDPAWSPAGTRLVFDRFRAGHVHLWSMRASDGAQLRQLTSGNTMDFEPAWSPDGSRVAFTRGHATGDPGDIFVLDLGSGTFHRLTHTTAYDHQVSWGPGGRRLVFERDFPASSAIMSINADGSGPVRLTHGQVFDVGPAFSPDGTRIAFGSDRAGGLLDDLWVMNSHGSDLHDVRLLRFSEGFPDWQSVQQQ